MASLKEVKKGDKVYLKTFTGMKLGEFEVVAANAKAFKIEKKDGSQITFSKETGKQTDGMKDPKYASTASVDPADGKADNVKAKEAKAKDEKKSNKKAAKVEEDDEDEPKSKSKGKEKSKSNNKKSQKATKEPEEELDEDDDFEDDLDEDDFEDQ